jgi:methylated-DNA-[protein]-cysteine S-methyltransferase
MFNLPYSISIPSPLGPMYAAGSYEALQVFTWQPAPAAHTWNPNALWCENLLEQTHGYFQGTRRIFDIPLSPQGTDFQHKVWRALSGVAYGTTQSYHAIAQATHNPKGSQAVGQANARNPVSILIPCHRIVSKKGFLTGYAGGIERKEYLLEHERCNKG